MSRREALRCIADVLDVPQLRRAAAALPRATAAPPLRRNDAAAHRQQRRAQAEARRRDDEAALARLKTAVAAEGTTRGALELKARLEGEGTPLGEECYAFLLALCVRDGRHTQALRLLAEMAARGVPLIDSPTYEALLGASAVQPAFLRRVLGAGLELHVLLSSSGLSSLARAALHHALADGGASPSDAVGFAMRLSPSPTVLLDAGQFLGPRALRAATLPHLAQWGIHHNGGAARRSVLRGVWEVLTALTPQHLVARLAHFDRVHGLLPAVVQALLQMNAPRQALEALLQRGVDGLGDTFYAALVARVCAAGCTAPRDPFHKAATELLRRFAADVQIASRGALHAVFEVCATAGDAPLAKAAGAVMVERRLQPSARTRQLLEAVSQRAGVPVLVATRHSRPGLLSGV